MNVDKYARFLPVAQSIAQLSKYPRTKVGALVLGPGYEIRSQGWNGAPRGCRADVDARMQDRGEALHWISHAEANAITNAARCGTPLEGCTLVTTHFPCMACAKLIVQAGLKNVVSAPVDLEFQARWREEINRATKLLLECDVRVFITRNE